MVKVRKGFTLVELLIVIVIIGILASTMMLNMGSSTAAAEAMAAVSDLRVMKAAVMLHMADHLFDSGGVPTLDGAAGISALVSYMDTDLATTGATVAAAGGHVFVSVKVTNTDAKARLAEMAKGKVRILDTAAAPTAAAPNRYAGTGDNVFMLAR